jgi:hypothetical protein
MVYYYAELNDSSIVKAVLQTYSQIVNPKMIQTDRLRSDLLGWFYQDGQFYPPSRS